LIIVFSFLVVKSTLSGKPRYFNYLLSSFLNDACRQSYYPVMEQEADLLASKSYKRGCDFGM
jgi:hypothetical protein